jgi:NRAMP (natural resistance-associated macrophage protein)-like metal ion transporter
LKSLLHRPKLGIDKVMPLSKRLFEKFSGWIGCEARGAQTRSGPQVRTAATKQTARTGTFQIASKLKRIFRILGPGFVTGASDDDPSGIATYAQTGVQFGYTQLWTALCSFPFMTVVQEMCGRIGMVTGKGLARIIKKNYPAPALYSAIVLLFVANTVNIGADLAAMASAGQLLWKLPFIVWLLAITTISALLQVFVPYKIYAKYLKYLTLSLFAYIITAFVVKQDWARILHATLVPSIAFNKEYLMNIVAILGTTISPYLFFWQASEEVEKSVAEGKQKEMCAGSPNIGPQDVKEISTDTTIGMFFSNLVMFFIIMTMASTLGRHGIHVIETSAQAAQALKPIAGNFAFLLFASGIIGTGLLAVPILAGSASYAISEAMGWREGLYKKLHEAWGFYSVIIVAIVCGFLINFTGIAPFKMLYYTAILNGLCAPPLMVLIMLIANRKDIMGAYANRRFSNILGWMITAIMTIAGLSLLFSMGQSK